MFLLIVFYIIQILQWEIILFQYAGFSLFGRWIRESNPIICLAVVFPSLGNCNHVVILVSIDFLSNLKRHALLYYTAFHYSYHDWDGFCDVF